MQGIGFFLVTFAALAAAVYTSLQTPQQPAAGGGWGLWQGLQLLGSTAGAAVVLLVPGLTFCCGGRRIRRAGRSWEEADGGEHYPCNTSGATYTRGIMPGWPMERVHTG
jgi:hypothetical protein